MTGSLRGLKKKLIKYKKQIYIDTRYCKSNHNFQFHFRYIQDLIKTKIDQAKRIYDANLSRELSDKSLSPKRYYSLLKTLLNCKNIPCIPPIYYNNKFISEIMSVLNSYFAGQCTHLVGVASTLG